MAMLLLPSETKTTACDRPLEIALLNNLGDAGLESGDRQIIDLLAKAGSGQTVRLHFFSLPSIARATSARDYMAGRYADFTTLRAMRLDGLFITGCEPRAARLPEERFWRELTEVIDWAEHHTRSTVFSCLAAHAAVLHMDGVVRRPLGEKRTGLFDVRVSAPHPLLAGMPPSIRVPHSRHNDLARDDLVAAGYQVLTEGALAGVDTFVKSWRSLFVYLQGHPEYDRDALRREYRRDVLRFLDGTSETYPSLPRDYFDPVTEVHLETFAREARYDRDPARITLLPLGRDGHLRRSAEEGLGPTLFRNWLLYLATAAADHAA